MATLWLALMLLAGCAWGQPRPETAQAFAQYAAAVEARIEQDRLAGHFLRAGSARSVAAKTLGVQPDVAIPGGQVQHWLGVRFIPNMTIARALPRLQDYDNRKRDMAPTVAESRILSREGDEFRVSLRVQQKEIISAVLDLVLRIRYRDWGQGVLEIDSRSESVRDVSGVDRGLLWGLNHYWRFVQRDGGVSVECEALVLARRTPTLVRWVADPMVARAARRTLEGTLEDMVRLVERGK